MNMLQSAREPSWVVEAYQRGGLEPTDVNLNVEPNVAGLVKLSTTDWPGKLVAVVFLQGCPWRCTYCHNKDILDPRSPSKMPWQDVLDFLAKRRGLLDGVVFSGGEPLLSAALSDAIQNVAEYGFEIGLHTGGAWPRKLSALLADDMFDWVGLDIKHLESHYDKVTGVAASGRAAYRSLEAVVQSGVNHEVRTTVSPTVHTRGDVQTLIEHLADYRSPNGNRIQQHVLQEVRPVPVAFPGWRLSDYLADDMGEFDIQTRAA